MKNLLGRFVPRLPKDRDTRRGAAFMLGIGLLIAGFIVFGRAAPAPNDVNTQLLGLARQAAPVLQAAADKRFSTTLELLGSPPTDPDRCTTFLAIRTTALDAFARMGDRGDTVRFHEAAGLCDLVLGQSNAAFADYRAAAQQRAMGYHYLDQQTVVAELLYAQTTVQHDNDAGPLAARLLVADALRQNRSFAVVMLRDTRLAALTTALALHP